MKIFRIRFSTRAIAVFVSLVGGIPFCRADLQSENSRGAELYKGCVQCHGKDGEGNQAYGAPRLAEQDAWYLRGQILKIQSGARQAPGENKVFRDMLAQLRQIGSEEDVTVLSEYISRLKSPPSAPTFAPDETSGKSYFAICISCHGERAEGNRNVAAPKLAGLQDWYIAGQLARFKAGERGASPSDGTGAVMMTIALAVPDEEAAKAVSAYIQTHFPQ